MRVSGRHQMGSAERHCLNCRPKEKSCHLASGPGQYQEPALNARRTLNARRKYLEAAFFQNSLSISILYPHNAPRSMFLWRLRSIRLQKKRLSMDLQWHYFKTHCSKVASRRSRRSVKLTTAKNHSKHCSRRQDGSRLQISCNVGNQLQRRSSADGGPYHPREPLLACEGCLWLQAAESAELHIRLTEVSGTGVGIYELRHLWACAAGSSAKGSPRARPAQNL